MNAYRRMAMAVTTCAVGLSLAACSAGITTESPAASRSPGPSRTASSSAVSSPAASSPPGSPSPAASASASPADTVSVDAPIGSFPVPRGAQVASNIACGKQLLIELGSVTPRQASAFYASALPRAGYIIASNNLSTDPTTGTRQGIAEVIFAGHGYSGLIIALAKLDPQATADPSMAALPSNLVNNTVEISLTPSGAASTPMCAS